MDLRETVPARPLPGKRGLGLPPCESCSRPAVAGWIEPRGYRLRLCCAAHAIRADRQPLTELTVSTDQRRELLGQARDCEPVIETADDEYYSDVSIEVVWGIVMILSGRSWISEYAGYTIVEVEPHVSVLGCGDPVAYRKAFDRDWNGSVGCTEGKDDELRAILRAAFADRMFLHAGKFPERWV